MATFVILQVFYYYSISSWFVFFSTWHAITSYYLSFRCPVSWLLHSHGCYTIFPNGTFNTLRKPFPSCHTYRSASWNSMFHASEKAFTVAHYAKTLIFNALHLRPIIRVYGHSLLFVSSHAILSDFTRHKHSFSHDNIAWICICSLGYEGRITSSIFCCSSAILFPHGVTFFTAKTRRLRSTVSP